MMTMGKFLGFFDHFLTVLTVLKMEIGGMNMMTMGKCDF
jgi:hypothetical protein